MTEHNHAVIPSKTKVSTSRFLRASGSLVSGMLILFTVPAATQALTPTSARDFADLSLEELMMETVTSVYGKMV